MATPPWALLRRLPRRSTDETVLPGHVSFDLRHPPDLSHVTLPLDGRKTPAGEPYVLAADHDGVLLSFSTAGADPLLHLFATKYADADATVDLLLPPRKPLSPPVAQGKYVVVELQAFEKQGIVKLLCINASVGSSMEWFEKVLAFPVSHQRPWPWACHGVFSFRRKLWWVDLSRGLLVSCDPSVGDPLLKWETLPSSMFDVTVPGIETSRRVGVSCDHVRYVVIAENGDSGNQGATVSVWTRNDDGGDAEWWSRDFSASFADVWADESYRRARLPATVPAIVVLHPRLPSVIFFNLDAKPFALDLSHASHALLSRKLEFTEAILGVPVPNFESIFRSLGMLQEVVRSTWTTPVEARAVHCGYYSGGPWYVEFLQIKPVAEYEAGMLLKFHRRGFEPFVAQLMEWSAFEYLKIVWTKKKYYDVYFRGCSGSRLERVLDVPQAVHMVPLPFPAEIMKILV